MIDLYKYPRLYLNVELKENVKISLNTRHVHYLRNVLRKELGNKLRIFNGKDGEWLALIEDLGKKSGRIELVRQIKQQPVKSVQLDLFFSPIKKQRMDILVEKAVEFGVSGLYPIITNRTENRKFNKDRVNSQIIEASEQCERMDLPVLYDMQRLDRVLSLNHDVPLYACLERMNTSIKPISAFSYKNGAAFIIGPEGGFDVQEVENILSAPKILPITLGQVILRTESAAIACLSYTMIEAT